MTLRYAHLAPDAFEEDYGRLRISVPEGKVKVLEIVRDEKGRYLGTERISFGVQS